MTKSALPLDGIVIFDISRALAGPFATVLLSDLGAITTGLHSVNLDLSVRSTKTML